MKGPVVILFLVLVVLHQDFWFWSNDTLIFGFVPVGLAYHAAFSISAALLWAVAIKIAWPKRLVAWADEPESGSDQGGGAQ